MNKGHQVWHGLCYILTYNFKFYFVMKKLNYFMDKIVDENFKKDLEDKK